MDNIDPTSIENLRTDVFESRFEEVTEPAPKPRGRPKKEKVEAPPPPAAASSSSGPSKAQQAKAAAEAERLEQEQEVEQQMKQAMLDKILAYRDRFKHVKKRNNVSIKSSIEELKDEIRHRYADGGVICRTFRGL